jgi:hypothetical protein
MTDEELRCQVCGREIYKEDYDNYDGKCWECWVDPLTEESDSMFLDKTKSLPAN